MKKKKLLPLCLGTLMFLAAFQSTAFAATQYDRAYSSWTSENASYGPDDGNYEVTSWDDNRCKTTTNVIYDSTDITSIRSYYNNDDCYPGLDITDVNNNFNSTVISSNIPDPHFDWDNDFPWTNGDEEAEVTCESPLSLSSGTQYYFYSWFEEEYSSGTATFQLNTSQSYWDSYNDEYQTTAYSQLGAGELTVDLP
ncbi:hypothetical protein [Desulfosporosinus sp. OT]|uniref:hypothetical protein n=1 Tax=Desulfosporosinus sp. OT TaxID=913865 RepID=UPI000223A1DE|nr:hypothetical protein [Desulfosporosinus sp. OT]EGW37206.1 hypothetical protein DOT_4745 [Desulfosporosinus sp. OT]